MKTKRTQLARRVSIVLLAATFASSALAQRVPASSSDSGRRAVVAIDQASINNNINNALNTANYAVSVGGNANSAASNAQNTANYAVNVANAALSAANAGYGRITGQFAWTNCNGMTSGCGVANGLCISGFPVPQWPSVPLNLCPAGSGYYGNYSVNQADSGGPGGGGAGGGSN
jgi:hypothetical protein